MHPLGTHPPGPRVIGIQIEGPEHSFGQQVFASNVKWSTTKLE